MQNGTIGEARTKAFLIDRFWILERSVDIHGADFLIQRRLYDRNLLDDLPPRFGIVQAKFSQSEHTSHYIRRDWVLDNEDTPRVDFFLLIHTGNEEAPQIFLLFSRDILEDFPLNDNDQFVVSSKKIFTSPKYQVMNKKNALDRIESSIQCAEFYKNRFFLFSKLSSAQPDFDAILPDFKENIDHRCGEIPEIFKTLKKEAFNTMTEIEAVHALLKMFVQSVDPIEACDTSEKLYYRFGNSISLPDVHDPDFYYGMKNFKEMVDNMRSDGILDHYIEIRESIAMSANSFLRDCALDEIDNNTVHRIEIEYSPDDFTLIDIRNSLVHIRDNELHKDFSKINHAREGSIVLSWKIGPQVKRDRSVQMNDCCLLDMMEKLYALKYYKDEDI